MRKIFLLFCISILITGCATVYEEAPSDKTTRNHRKFRMVFVGMTQQEIVEIMGKNVVIGYQKSGNNNEFTAITIDNPYRIETLKGQGKTIEVYYYLTYVVDADDSVTNNELVPLVFEQGRVIGTGWPFLENAIAQYNLKSQ